MARRNQPCEDWGGVFCTEGRPSAKVSNQEQAWHVQEIAKHLCACKVVSEGVKRKRGS